MNDENFRGKNNVYIELKNNLWQYNVYYELDKRNIITHKEKSRYDFVESGRINNTSVSRFLSTTISLSAKNWTFSQNINLVVLFKC